MNEFDLKIFKAGIDFESLDLDANFQYHLWFKEHNFKKGDIAYFDMCIFKDTHTYIKGIIQKAYKHKVIIEYEYL